MEPDHEKGAELDVPSEPAEVEVHEVDQELGYDKGAKLDSASLHQSEVNAPAHSKVVPPGK